MSYYINNDYERYQKIWEEKLRINNLQARKVYLKLFWGFVIVFSIILPIILSLFIYENEKLTYLNFNFTKISLIYITIIYTYLLCYFLINKYTKKYEENDTHKELKLFKPLIFKLILLSILLELTMYIILIIILKFGNYMNYVDSNFNNFNKIIYFSINLFTYNLFVLWFLYIAWYVPQRIKMKLKDKKNESFIYTYWLYFLKSIIIYDVKFLIGFSVLAFLIIIPEIVEISLLSRIGYYSFFVTGLVMTFFPIVNGLIRLGSTFQEYSSHIINDNILPQLRNHTIIIGAGNLGRLLVKGCFFDIHPERYGYKSVCDPNDMQKEDFIEELSDYNVIIDNNLDIYIVSRRMIIIDKNPSLYKNTFGFEKNYFIGILSPGYRYPKSEGIMILGICGDANNSYILKTAQADESQLIVNATPDSNLSLNLAKRDYPKKQILAVTNTPTFDALTTFTYDKSIYLIDTKLIEGISISQRIILWIIKYVKNEIRISKESKSFAYHFPIIVISGKGKILYYTIQSLFLSIENYINNEEEKKRIQNKIILFTNDDYIKNELHSKDNYYSQYKKNKFKYWNIHPLPSTNTDIIKDEFCIKTYIRSLTNFDDYLEIIDEEKPKLFVIASDTQYDGLSIFNRASNASQLNESSPAILVYSHKSDKDFIDDQLKKHYINNLKRKEIIGFPSQLPKESKLIRDYVTANQFASMLRSLIPEKITIRKKGYLQKLLSISKRNNEDQNPKEDIVGEITISLINKPGAIARTLAEICGLQITSINASIPLPSFVFCYSFDERRFKNTFIFTGTAKSQFYDSNDTSNTENYCFLNCDNVYRSELMKMLKNNLAFVYYPKNLKEPGMFRNCPITNIIRHQGRHYDVIYHSERQRFFTFNTKKLEINTNEFSINPSIPNYAHIKIWGETSYPGTLAESLSNLILGKIQKERYFGKDILVPNIRFSTNFLYPKSPDISKPNGQESLYVELWKEKSFYQNYKNRSTSDNLNRSVEDRKILFENGVIRAIKIKKGGKYVINNNKLLDPDSNWLDYTIKLSQHLNSQYIEKYPVYLIEKFFVEGTECEGKVGIMEISNYKIIHKFNYRLEDSFQIVRKLNNPIFDRYSTVQEFIPANSFKRFYSVHKKIQENIQHQIYELVLIRTDITRNAINSNNKNILDENINMLFFIDNL